MGITDKEATTAVTVTSDSYVEKDPYVVMVGPVVGDTSTVSATVTFYLGTYAVADTSTVSATVTFDLECLATITDTSTVSATVTFSAASTPATTTSTWATESKASSTWATESAP